MFLIDLAQFAEQEERKKPTRLIAPGLAIAGGGAIGGVGTNATLGMRRNKLVKQHTDLSSLMNRYSKSKSPKNSPDKNRKIVDEIYKMLDKQNGLHNRIVKSANTHKRNVALGAVGGAALGYGAYRGGKALVNRLRKKESK